MFDYAILRYSVEPRISLSQVKAGFLVEDVDCKKIAGWMEKHEVGAIVEGDERYSHHRLRVASKPYIVYYQGNLDLLYRKKLGIVGSRKPTSYAIQAMKTLFEQLQGKDLVTISGGAEGIDELCHHLSIEHGIPTICVLGGGLAYYLSHARRNIFERIVANGGLILSEFRLKEQPAPYTFPQRNRIIAGLSDLLFVPCATEESGSLITVDDAIKARVPVYGIPGSIYEAGQQGINKGISHGTIKAIRDVKEFVASLGLQDLLPVGSNSHEATQEGKNIILDEQQKLLYDRMNQQGSVGVEMIAQALEMHVLEVSMILTELEMEGFVYEERPGVWKSK